MDLSRRSLTRQDGEVVDLTTGEFDMLAVMARNAGRVLSRDRLMDLTRGRSLEAFDRTIDAQIARLRKKIEEDPANPQIIKSVRGRRLCLHIEARPVPDAVRPHGHAQSFEGHRAFRRLGHPPPGLTAG